MRRITLTLVLMGGAVAAGCDNDDRSEADRRKASASVDHGTVLKLSDTSAPGRWSFDKKRLEAEAGRVTIEFRNPSDLGHNVRIQTGRKCCFRPGYKDVGGTAVVGGLASDSGKSARATLHLKAGRYWFLCANAGHWQAGQRGELLVKPRG